MSAQQSDNHEPEQEHDTVQITLYPHGGEEKALRQLGYGLSPFVLIEPEMDDDSEDVTWKFVGSWVDELDDLVDLLEASIDILRAAVEQSRSAQ